MEQTIRIFAAADENYAQPVSVMMASVLANNSSDNRISFSLIDGGLSDASKHRIRLLQENYTTEINFIDIDRELFKTFPLVGHLTEASYYRLAIPELADPEVDKVLYLDCDILVLGDLSDLWSTSLGDNYFAAVEDMGDQKLSMDIPPDKPYFNSGVMLMNLKKWRQDHIFQRMMTYISDNPSNRSCDQDALNAVLWGQWLKLDLKWNVQTPMFLDDPMDYPVLFDLSQLTAAVRNPAILHFTASDKPWMAMCQHPLSRNYLDYLELTAWKGSQPAQMTVSGLDGFYPFSPAEMGRFISGWSFPEEGFIWTRGRKASLLLGIIDRKKFLTVNCWPLKTDQLPGQHVVMRIKDKVVGEFYVDQEMEMQIIIKKQRKPVLIELELPDASSPWRHGLSDDRRLLGIAVKSIRLDSIPRQGILGFWHSLINHLPR